MVAHMNNTTNNQLTYADAMVVARNIIEACSRETLLQMLMKMTDRVASGVLTDQERIDFPVLVQAIMETLVIASQA